jgi:serine/threonine protein kinase
MNGAGGERELGGAGRRANDMENERAAADRIATPLAPASSAELEPGVGDRIDSYRLVRLIGAGSTGRVFEVEHERIGRRAAMKTLAASHAAHAGAIKRLFTEALAVNRINHPHIVEVTDLVENGIHYPAAPRPGGAPPPRVNAIVMELLEGQSLAQAIAEHGPLEPGRFLGILAQVCRALAAAHAAGFVHRDLKPDNIFLVDRGRDEEFVKLLDFGLTKAFGSEGTLTQTPAAATMDGFFVGTPAYVSPEQASGRPIDHRTDIYALGVVLFELICGRLPFEGPSVNEFLIQHVTVPAPSLPPDVRATKLGATLDAIVQRCLQKDPAGRFPSAERLARLLQELSRGGEIAFTGIGGYLADQQRTVRARDRDEAIRAGLGLGLGLLLALGAGAGISHLRHKGAAPVVVSAPALTLPHVSPVPPAPPVSLRVTLLFESDPPGAEVRMVHGDTGDAEALGTTPFRRTIARGSDEVTFDIHLDGYDTMRVPTPATSDRTINVSLNRSPPARAAARKAKAARAAKTAGSDNPRAADAKPVRRPARAVERAVEIDQTDPYARDKTLDPFR